MLEAYCWPQSVDAGARVGLHLSTDAGPVAVSVARDGAGRTVVLSEDGVHAGRHDVPADASAAGCGWPVAFEIPVASDWPSGYYAVEATAGDERSDACFVVRPRREDPAPILLVLATATWNAYNDWGGPSLYTGGVRVSFERPLAKGFLDKPSPARRKMQPEPDREGLWYFRWAEPLGLSVWSGGAGWATWEQGFVRWAESNGYRLDVAISQDLEERPEILDGHRLYLSVGHDEYWSWRMRDAVDAFTAAGGNAAIFSGNTCFWQVRFDEDQKAMTCFKYRAGEEDPVRDTPEEYLLTGPWSDRRVGRPETWTTGLTFTRGGYSRYGLGVPRASGAYTVHRPDHWVFDGTTLRYGDALGLADAIVAYEVDGCDLTTDDGGLPAPTHADGAPDSLEVLATAPARLWMRDEQPSRYAHEPGELEHAAMAVFGETWREHVDRLANNHAVMGVFTTPGGGTVFNAGVTDWSCGLGDAAVARITRNVLDQMSA